MGRAESPERFEGRDVRRALWLSLLSGANAGFGYGAYGIWNWHRQGYDAVWQHVFGPSPNLQEALGFPEAYNIGLTVELWRRYRLNELEPLASEKDGQQDYAWAALGEGRGWIAYCGHPRILSLPEEAETARPTVWDLTFRRIWHPRPIRWDGRVWIDLGTARGDALLVLEPSSRTKV